MRLRRKRFPRNTGADGCRRRRDQGSWTIEDRADVDSTASICTEEDSSLSRGMIRSYGRYGFRRQNMGGNMEPRSVTGIPGIMGRSFRESPKNAPGESGR